MSARLVSHVFLVIATLMASDARGARFTATGISVPFFNDAGELTHRMIAASGTRAGDVQNLQSIEIHYFAPDDPNTIVQKLEASEATWDDTKGTLVGRGPVVLATVENRLTGDGFDFSLETSLLQIHRNFTMNNREVRLTSDRAKIELIVDQAGDELRVRDVKRCEAIGNLHIVVQPTAQKKYRFEEAFSDLAIYDGVTQVVSLPHPTRIIHPDGGEGRFNTFMINLQDEARRSAVGR